MIDSGGKINPQGGALQESYIGDGCLTAGDE
jgi:hypothetical protein